MGLLSTVSNWVAARYEKNKAEMEALGLCPDCNGKGFNSFNIYEYYYTNPLDCPSCNGTGSYTDWLETNQ